MKERKEKKKKKKREEEEEEEEEEKENKYHKSAKLGDQFIQYLKAPSSLIDGEFGLDLKLIGSLQRQKIYFIDLLIER